MSFDDHSAEADLSGIPDATSIFAAPSALPLHAPDFPAIADDQFQAVIEEALAIRLAEMERIADNPAAPTFVNTLAAMERAGQVYHRASAAFGQLVSANINPVLADADTALAPQQAAAADAIYLNAALFARVKAIYDQRDTLGLSGEDLILLETTYADFVHRGALLNADQQAELRQINTQLSTLSSQFSKAVTKGTNAGAITVATREELAGLTDAQIAAAALAAKERGLAGQYVLALQNTTSQALLANLDNRDVRERLFRASIERNQGGEFDTLETTRQMIALRTRKAELFGEADYAAWKMYDRMAYNPATALKFMRQMVPALAATQEREADLLNERIAQDGHNFTVQPWDWPYYAEKVRQERFSLDENAIKQYFVVDRVLEDGAFFMAEKLYGLTFQKRSDIPVYHPDVSVYTVFDADGSELALFYFDPFARESKRGGAWMNSFIEQSHLLGLRPVIGNTQNVVPPAAGEPALASFDDVITLFHEFGHALHGFFANQQFPSLSGTNTARDWVEFPSQFHENFAVLPEVLSNYARHCETGEQIPAALIEAIDRASKFNQGYALGENLSASLLDMEWHAIMAGEAPDDVMTFEAEALGRLGLRTDLVPPRYHTPYFRHMFEHSYDAGYYSYLWTEMLHHDAYSWVAENGGMTRQMGAHIRETFLGQGHSKPYEQMYRDFTGREPRVEPLLEARGLLENS